MGTGGAGWRVVIVADGADEFWNEQCSLCVEFWMHCRKGCLGLVLVLLIECDRGKSVQCERPLRLGIRRESILEPM